MSRYVIEIAKEYEEYFKGILICGIADGKFAVDVIAREDLEELNSDYINKHYGDLQDTAYKKGLEEGREQKSCDTCAYRHNKLLCADCKWTYRSRYKVDSIGVGDVVKTYNGITFVVTKATTDGIVVGFEGEGNTCRFALSEVTKTGEHYNINEILGGLSDD